MLTNTYLPHSYSTRPVANVIKDTCIFGYYNIIVGIVIIDSLTTANLIVSRVFMVPGGAVCFGIIIMK